MKEEVDIHRDCMDHWGRGAQDVHLVFHMGPEFWLFEEEVDIHRDCMDHWGRGAQDVHLVFHMGPEFWLFEIYISKTSF